MNDKPASPTSPSKPPQPRTQERYLPGDPIPVPDAIESNTESNWALFSDVQRDPDPEFLDTVPASLLDEKLTGTPNKQNP